MDLGPIYYVPSIKYSLQRNLLENLFNYDQINTLNCTEKEHIHKIAKFIHHAFEQRQLICTQKLTLFCH